MLVYPMSMCVYAEYVPVIASVFRQWYDLLDVLL